MAGFEIMRRETIWKTSVATTTEAEDAVSELLATIVAPSPSAYTDAESGVTAVSVYSTKSPKNLAATKTALRCGLNELKRFGINVGAARISIIKLPRENWAESWKRHFPPLEIGDALLVKPSWIKRKLRPGQKLVVLDPGLSFGTGQHPTTGFCLHEMVKPSEQQRSFLDMGTGSGILAIAAAKLGYAPVHAFDFDPQCVHVSRANARTNRIENKICITQADLTRLPKRSAKRYDFVCANLLANLLIAERGRIFARVTPGGTLVVAGILTREFHEVQGAYEAAGWRLVASKVEKEWRSGSFVRSGKQRRGVLAGCAR
ncbi:MAG: 50S ribosomal protein L11 methyltransferase [Verrucomicrobiales bacterium]|nr:MAG: 50S ribosomal protein L11 methyltransferase [Verrucomicrobiales bacterium]